MMAIWTGWDALGVRRARVLSGVVCVLWGVVGCNERSAQPMPAISGPAVVSVSPNPWAAQGLASGSQASLSLIAGDIGGDGNLDGLGTAARFSSPGDIVMDASGNFYVAELVNHTIRKVTPAGEVSTLAGQSRVAGAADGLGQQAQFSKPDSLAVDLQGNLFVTDSDNHTIRKITPEGRVTTLAGLAGEEGYEDGVGSRARFNSPSGIAVARDGTLYVADSDNHVIRKVSAKGVVTTLAGSPGEEGSDDGVGSSARFASPVGLALDAAGSLFVADWGNHTVRKISLSTGAVSTLAGRAGEEGHEDGDGSAARFHGVLGLRVDALGNVWLVESENHVIRQITPQGKVSTWAGVPGESGHVDGPLQQARFDHPAGLVVAPDGDVYVADTFNESIRKVSPKGDVATWVGMAAHPGQTNGTGSAARFNQPQSVAVDAAGALYVADRDNHTIRKVTPSGRVVTLAGTAGTSGQSDGAGGKASFNTPQGLMVDMHGLVIVADSHSDTLRLITPEGGVSTLAGRAGQTGDADGARKKRARFNTPVGVRSDANGNLYVADYENHTLRKIDAQGVVSTLAGQAPEGGHADGSGALARLNEPTDVAVDARGVIYVADSANHVIRKVTPEGQVSTWVGQAGEPGDKDGQGSAARLQSPHSLTFDESGNLYVADLGNHMIRKITPQGHVSTVMGRSTEQGIRLGSQARLDSPVSVAWLGAGRLAVLSNHALLLATLPTP